jgi:hypothetical protein
MTEFSIESSSQVPPLNGALVWHKAAEYKKRIAYGIKIYLNMLQFLNFSKQF